MKFDVRSSMFDVRSSKLKFKILSSGFRIPEEGQSEGPAVSGISRRLWGGSLKFKLIINSSALRFILGAIFIASI